MLSMPLPCSLISLPRYNPIAAPNDKFSFKLTLSVQLTRTITRFSSDTTAPHYETQHALSPKFNSRVSCSATPQSPQAIPLNVEGHAPLPTSRSLVIIIDPAPIPAEIPSHGPPPFRHPASSTPRASHNGIPSHCKIPVKDEEGEHRRVREEEMVSRG